ncbi:MAG: methyltransferase domain-containing protein [Acidobacteria bacterium]|nr:methyltransferase domain-containing protein [Acidobacteriota bacterium]
MDADEIRTEELTEAIRAVQDRVRSRHPRGVFGVGDIPIPDLMPLVHARDAAEAKVAAIGTVNPRRGGLLNAIAQTVKKTVARALDWHIREQVEFNRGVIASIQATLDALEQHTRAMSQMAGHFHARISEVRGEIAGLRSELITEGQRVAAWRDEQAQTLSREAAELKDVRAHWAQWRVGWEEKLNRAEVYMLRTISELNAAFQHRSTLTEAEFRKSLRDQHANYDLALQKAVREIQDRLWADLARIRAEYEQVIQAELRVVRQRGLTQTVPAGASGPAREAAPAIDWLKFADKFRGPEEHVRRGQALYLDRFAGTADVLDLGCGRGEFLEAAKAAGIGVRGVDLNAENVAICREKGLDAETADMFECLGGQADGSLGGVYCSQVIEHLPAARVPELVRLAAAKLRPGALMAFETPNPECLAILATHFYLDPTHVRPVPPMLMAFYLEEAGLGGIEIIRLNPAAETIPAVSDLPESVRSAFFGGMDYAIFGRKL